MTIERRSLRWNGWGHADYSDPLVHNDAAWKWMARAVGVDALPHTPSVAAEDLELPQPRVTKAALEYLNTAIGAAKVSVDPYERLYHARGRSYVDLLHLRAGDLDALPDLVVYPANPLDVLEVLRLAQQEEMTVIPYGGGSSVVGGVNALLTEGASGVITLDLTRMNRVLAVDPEAMTAVVEAGVYGPELERQLNEHGVMLGHFPQSFEFSTLGGWIAARGAGQQSGRYGKPEKWLVGAKLVSPAGIWATECFPASAAGPSLTDVVVGSEGRLGVITEATVRVHPLPEERDYRGFLFKTFEEGTAFVRTLAQSDMPIAMMRLSDADETFFFRVFAALGHQKSDPESLGFLQRMVLRWNGFPERACVLLVGLEGSADSVSWSRARVLHMAGRAGAISLGRKPGIQWFERRFAAPYARDPMLDRGLGIDTLETATRWSNIQHLYGQVRTALEEAMAEVMPQPGARGLIMAHISHCYPDGASLYFTYVFPRDAEDPVAQWAHLKKAASEAIVEHGGTISHHHGVGTDHRPWIMEEKGPAGVNILRSVQHALDPGNVLNAGKLLPD